MPVVYDIMGAAPVLPLQITCTCHQAKFAICCLTPQVTSIAPKICNRGFSTR